MSRKPTYDPRCYDLAELFLEDERHLGTAANIDELANDIQQCIEGFIAVKNAEMVEAEADRQSDYALEDKRDEAALRDPLEWVQHD